MVEELALEAFIDSLESDGPFTLVDTRPADSYEGWHVRGAENVPFDPDEGLTGEDLERVEDVVDDGPVVTICGKGLTSTPFAFALEDHGFDDVAVVTGGMEAYSTLHETVPVETDTEDLLVRQLQRRATGCLGYVIGSRGAESAIVVDPTRQTEVFTVAAAELGCTVERVVDTHVHADHVSGGRQLADELSVPYHLGEGATDRDVALAYTSLVEGDRLEVGPTTIEVLHTPGHTSEHISLRVAEEAVLPGDTLFVESVGRTELQFGGADAETGAELLYDSLHETLFELADHLTVLPGHVSLTDDTRFEVSSVGEPVAATLGTLRSDLALLGLEEAAFVDRLTRDTKEPPANYERIVAANTGQEPLEDPEARELEIGPNNCAA